MSESSLTFEPLLEHVASRNKSIPRNELRQRLIGMGLKDVLDCQDNDQFGIPSRYIDHLDETTLALHYFLRRLKNEGGELKIYGTHKLQKGDDKTLSPWVSERARLFIELQNMILLMNSLQGRKAEIRRIFILQDISDVAFFNQSAINVLSEQASLGIKMGFIFQNEFGPDPSSSTDWTNLLSSSLVIDYSPNNDVMVGLPNFYFLYDILRRPGLHSHAPYVQGCFVKWLENKNSLVFPQPNDYLPSDALEKFMSLFENWKPFEDGPQTRYVLKLADEDTHRFSNNALIMLSRAFNVYHELKNPTYDTRLFTERVFDSIVTPDLMRLERAMSLFDSPGVKTLRAVDATSVKNTLKLHQSDPNYRQWLRRTVNHVLGNDSNCCLERIYVIDDTNSKKDEYPVLKKVLQYYIDYLHLEMAGIETDPSCQDSAETREKEECFDWTEKWKSLKGRLKIYVTTATTLDKYSSLVSPAGLKALNVFKGEDISVADLGPEMARLDYLFNEEMIYDFNSPRGDPGELKFEAYLIRKTFKHSEEWVGLFEFKGINHLGIGHETKIRRARNLLKSIDDYLDRYKRVEDEKFRQVVGDIKDETLDKIAEILRKDIPEGKKFTDLQRKLLDYRQEIETSLYPCLYPIALYAFDMLKYLSIEVNLFDSLDKKFITQIAPFDAADFDIEKLAEEIVTTIEKRKLDGVKPPNFPPEDESKHKRPAIENDPGFYPSNEVRE